MKDYSPLFNQGLFSIVATPAVTHFRKPTLVPLVVLPQAPTQENSVQARRSKRNVNGRSFLHLKKTSVHAELDSFKAPSLPRTATGVTFQSSRTSGSSSTRSSSPTSPSRRALPLPKPAPLSSLPAIPISTAPTTSTSTPASPIASSTALPPSASSSSSAARRKHASLAPSFFSTRTDLPAESVLSDFLMDRSASLSGPSLTKEESVRSVSTAYRKRRRQDALQALEGRGSRGASSRRRERAPSNSHHHHHHHHHNITSFMPSILHEVEEAEDPMKLLLEDAVAGCAASSFRSPTTKHHLYRSHLSFGSTAAAPHAFAIKPPSRDSNAIFSAASSVAPKTRSSSGMLLMSPTTPCFSVSYPGGEDSSSVLSGAPPRRASTGTGAGAGASKGSGWGMNFIDLVDDDGTSSVWRWSHVA